MKKFGKLLSLLLVIIIGVSAFTSCKKSAKTDEDIIREMTNTHFEGIFTFDTEKLTSCFEPGSKIDQEFRAYNIESELDGIREIGYSDEDIEKLKTAIYEKSSYEIIDIQTRENDTAVIVKSKRFSVDSYNKALVDAGIYEIIAEKLGYATRDALFEALENGEITAEDGNPYYFEAVKEKRDEIAENLNFSETESCIYFEEKDGKWYIVAIV